MTKPVFNPEIIGELRKRVAAHNEIVAASHPAMVVKLQGVKKLYKRWFSGGDPHAHALAMLDGRLLSMQTAALGDLAKARRPFDQGRHPRGRGGQFRATGHRHQVHQIGLINRSSITHGGGDRGDDDALLQAAQTQVIPETRYTVFGPPIAAATGVGLGAIAGASARPGLPWQGGGSLLDRLTTRIAGAAGRGTGKLVGRIARNVVITRPRQVLRSAIPAINDTLGTSLPRPRAHAGREAGERIIAGARRGGELIGRGAGHISSLASYPAARFGQVVTRVHGPIAGRLVAGAVGAAFPGVLFASTLHNLQSRIGPYEDTRWPRRVQKMVGDLWDAPEVLAKQAELLTHANLAKAADSSEELAKVVGGATVARALSMLRGPVARAFAFRPRVYRPSSVAMTIAPPPGQAAALEAFREQRAHYQVPRNIGVRIARVGAHVAGLGLLGGAAGALTGAGLASFAMQHPRDPRTGKFRTKGQAARAGALHGAIVGSGIGLAAGIVAARTGQRALLNEAIEQLRGRRLVGEPGVNISAEMTGRTKATVRDHFARTYFADNERRLNAGLPKTEHLTLPESGTGRITPDAIEHHIGKKAVAQWMAEEGTVMAAGPEAWYRHQVETEFEKYVARELKGLPEAERTLPRKNSAASLIDSVDESKDALTRSQRTIWNDAKALRKRTLQGIEDVYKGRATQQLTHETAETQLRNRKTHLDVVVKRTTMQHWAELQRSKPDMTALRSFARDIELPNPPRSKDELVAAINEHLPKWHEGAETELTSIDDQIRAHADAAREAVHAKREDFTPTEREAIRNPFAPRITTKKNQGEQAFFRAREAGIDTPEGLDQIKQKKYDAAIKPFRQELQASEAAALAHLDALVTTEEASLRARIPQHNVFAGYIKRQLPEFASYISEGVKNYARLSGAHRRQLPEGQLRDFYDFLHQNNNIAAAWKTVKKWSEDAQKFWDTGPGKWLRSHWKTIYTVAGAATAVGAIDLQAKGGLKNKVKINPAKWHMPRDIDVVTEYPDPLKRPDEAVFGLKFKDRSGRDKFLEGIHVTSPTQYQHIPYGADVTNVLSSVRGGGAGRANTIQVNNEGDVDRAIQRAESQGDIDHNAGPPGFEYKQRKPGMAGDREARDVAAGFFRRHIKPLNDHNVPVNQSTKRHDLFYQSLHDLFDGRRSELLNQRDRAGLLFGTDTTREKRGVFANDGKPYQGTDKAKIAAELARQPHADGAAPQNEAEYAQLHRALSLGADHFGLSADQRSRILQSLNQAYRRGANAEPPRSAAGAGNIPPDIDTEINDMLARYPERTRAAVHPEWGPDQGFRDDVAEVYNAHVSDYFARNPNTTEAEQNEAGIRRVRSYVEGNLRRGSKEAAEPVGDLYKLFGLTKLFDEQRHPRARAGLFRTSGQNAPPQIGAISGAHQPQPASPGPQSVGEFAHMGATRPIPPSPGMAPTQAGGSDLRQATRPAHVLGQLGTYGLSQAGWDVVGNIASHFMPGGGMVARATKFGLKTLGSFGGSVGGLKAGQALGRGLGDRSPQGESPGGEGIARGIAGGMGQIAYNEFAQTAVRRGIASGTARLLGGAAGTALDPFIGPAGTILGSALAGALTDEGTAILYRHLSRYGQHVPQHALKHFGHKAPA